MSGFAGIVSLDDQRLPDQGGALQRMVGALRRKGQDARGTWEEGAVSLGLTVFRSTPEQANETGPTAFEHVVVVADACLYDREALLDALYISRAEQRAISDSEAIARAYLRWGSACVDHLEGDFAFALWDRRERTLFCARDLFAVRPFTYACTPSGLIFASNLEAFRASGIVRITPDPVRVYDALTYKWLALEEPERCAFRELARLPAGYTLTYAQGKLELARYGLLSPSRAPLPRDARELPDAFRAHFERAVARRLRSSGKVSSMLSGGLDSGAVVCAARNVLRRAAAGPLITCSALSDPPHDQETEYVRAVQRGGDLRSYDLTTADMPQFADDMVAYLEGSALPLGEWSHLQMWLACAITAQRGGARVMFSGESGDVALGVACSPTQRALREGALWDAYALPLEYARFYGQSARDLLRVWWGGSSRYMQEDVLRWLSPPLYWALRRKRHEVIRRSYHRSCLKPLAPALWDEYLARFSAVRASAEWPSPEREDHYLARGADRALAGVGEAWDRVFAWAGVEVRHPILDRELVEFCMAVPWRERTAGGRTKSLLRRSGLLPPEHADQKAMPNANSVARWAMCRAAEPWLSQRLERSEPAEEWFETSYLTDVRRRWKAGERSGELQDEVLELVALALTLVASS